MDNLMNTILTFITVLAWLLGIFSTFVTVLSIYGGIRYEGSLLQIKDTLNGLTRTYPVGKFLLTAAICWAWIIARWIS